MAAVNKETFTLNTGYKIPKVGFGCMRVTKDGIVEALKQGYRHLDTAYIYDRGVNETEVGKAIIESGIPREEIFVVTKLWNTEHKNVAQNLDDSLKRLGLDYVDSYLMHFPYSEDKQNPDHAYTDWNYIDTYREMVKIYHSTKKIRSLGVSNFTIENLENLKKDKDIDVIPAINQIEAHPLLAQPALMDYMKKEGVLGQAYSPLGGEGAFVVNYQEVKDLATKYNVTPGQILISWAVQRGSNVIPRSVKFDRIAANIRTIELSKDDFEALNNLANVHGKERVNDTWKMVHAGEKED